MKPVRYVGESTTGVEVVHPDPEMPDANTVTVCPPGEVVELPDDIAVDLVAAGTFEAAEPRPRRGGKASAEEND